MNRERWHRVAAAVEAVLDADEDKRDIVLEEACNTSESLQADIHAVLRAHAAVADSSWPPPPKSATRSTCDFGINSRFTISNCLGEGGFGIVYRAWDKHLSRPVALKRLRSENADYLVRFKREFRALAELSHPGIVSVYELFVERNQAWFTMELIEGRPITEAFNSRTTSLVQSEAWATQVRSRFQKLAEAVSAAHDAGFLHRDLKPSNVLVTREDRVIVLDFGLATDLRSQRDPHSLLCGTPLYMAPEQFGTSIATAESDWYAVGAMLYETLMRRLPFSHDQGDLIGQKTQETPPPQLSPHLEKLAGLACLLLHPNPTKRPCRDQILSTLGIASRASSIPKSRALAPTHFVGRTSELLELVAAQKCMAKGGLSIVRIHGCAGCGKTALIHRFLELAQSEDPTVVVLNGRCRDNETLGFRAVDTVVDALAEYLRRLPQGEAEALLPQHLRETVAIFPTLRNVPAVTWSKLRSFTEPGSDERRFSAFQGLRELLGRLAHTRPVIVVIDDLQWSDAESPALFRHLLRSPHAPPLLLVVAHRSDPINPSALDELVASMSEAAQPVELHLPPLSQNETRVLAQGLLGKAHPLIDDVVEQSAGLAFLVTELAQCFLPWTNESRNVPCRKDHPANLLSQLLLRIPSEALALLELLAISCRPLELTLVGRAASLFGADALAAFRLLRTHHLATVSSDCTHLEIYHEHIRHHVLGTLTDERRGTLHRDLARAIVETNPFDHDGLVYHFRAAGDLSRASYHALFAADCLERDRRFDEAARFLRIVLELDRSEQQQRGALLQRLGDCESRAGRGPASASVYLDAAELCGCDESQQRTLIYLAAEQLIRSGHLSEGRTLLEHRVFPKRFQTPRSHGTLDAKTTLWRSRTLLFSQFVYRRKRVGKAPRLQLEASWVLASNALMLEYSVAKHFQAQHLALALESGDPQRAARAMGVEMLFSSLSGTRSRAKQHETLARLETTSENSNDPVLAACVPIWRAILCWLYGDFSSCLLAATEAAERVSEHGARLSWELATAHAFSLSSLAWQGRLEEHRVRSQELLVDAKARGDLYAETLFATLAHTSISCLAADAPSEIDELFARLDIEYQSSRWQIRDLFGFYGHIERWLYTEDYERAYAELSAVWPSLEQSHWMRVQVVVVLLNHLRGRTAIALMSLSPERTDELSRVVVRAARALDQEQAPWATGLSRLLQASLERAQGKLTRDALIARIETAQRALESTNIQLYTYATRRALCLLDERKSDGSIAALDRELARRGLVSPARFTRMLAPGLV